MLFPAILFFVMGIAMMTGSLGMPTSRNPEGMMTWFSLYIAFLAVASVLFGMAYAVGSILAGRYMQQRKNYAFCIVMGGVDCIFQPLGTVLGVLTLLLLTRPTVKAMFERAAAAPSTPTPV